MLVLGGLRFEVGPDDRLSADERMALGRLSTADGPTPESLIAVRVVEERLWPEEGERPAGPAEVEAREGSVYVRHRFFQAEIDPRRAKARLWRAVPTAF